MWARNASPVATFTRPRPSMSTFARSRVSLLLRVTSAALLKAHLHGVRVRAQPLHRGKPHTSFTQHLEVTAIETQHAGALHEGVHAEGRPEPSRAGRREGVVWAGSVITERHRRIGSHEHRACVLD